MNVGCVSRRIVGRWHRFDDGEARPVVDARVLLPDGRWLDASFVLDSGADRTVLDASFREVFAGVAIPADDAPRLGGIGGVVSAFFVNARLAFQRDDSEFIRVSGQIGVFTDPTATDVPLLGRDVTDNFSVIYSFPNQQVLLLAPPHRYQVSSPAPTSRQ